MVRAINGLWSRVSYIWILGVPPYDEIVKENSSLKAENAVLKGQLAWYQRDKYGPGKSETLDRAQIVMKLEGLAIKAVAPTVETVTYERTKPAAEKRLLPAQTFAHLPVRETLVIEQIGRASCRERV